MERRIVSLELVLNMTRVPPSKLLTIFIAFFFLPLFLSISRLRRRDNVLWPRLFFPQRTCSRTASRSFSGVLAYAEDTVSLLLRAMHREGATASRGGGPRTVTP